MSNIFRHKRRGSQAIEFALILPLLLVVLFGIIEYGWYFSKELSALNLVRDAARVGATADVAVAPTEASEYALARWSGAGLSGVPSVTVNQQGVPPQRMLTLEVSGPHEALTGLIPVPDTVGGALTMRMEDQSEE
jgi:hypothetical protein